MRGISISHSSHEEASNYKCLTWVSFTFAHWNVHIQITFSNQIIEKSQSKFRNTRTLVVTTSWMHAYKRVIL